jgi:hypothetical protein
MAPGSLPGHGGAHSQPGPRTSRRVALLLDPEQLAELPARDPRAARGPGQLRPDVHRPLSA